MLILLNFIFLIYVSSANNDLSYSYEPILNYKNQSWMSQIPDNTDLRFLSLPGTHNSMSLYGGIAV